MLDGIRNFLQEFFRSESTAETNDQGGFRSSRLSTDTAAQRVHPAAQTASNGEPAEVNDSGLRGALAGAALGTIAKGVGLSIRAKLFGLNKTDAERFNQVASTGFTRVFSLAGVTLKPSQKAQEQVETFLGKTEQRRPGLQTENHASWADAPLTMARLGRSRFASQYLPVLSSVIESSGGATIIRPDERIMLVNPRKYQKQQRAAIKSLSHMIDYAKKFGVIPTIFVSGTRDLHAGIGDPKKGVTNLIVDSGATLLVQTHLGTQQVLSHRVSGARLLSNFSVGAGYQIYYDAQEFDVLNEENGLRDKLLNYWAMEYKLSSDAAEKELIAEKFSYAVSDNKGQPDAKAGQELLEQHLNQITEKDRAELEKQAQNSRRELIDGINKKIFDIQVRDHVALVREAKQRWGEDKKAKKLYDEFIKQYAPAFYYIKEGKERELYYWAKPRAEVGDPNKYQGSVEYAKKLYEALGVPETERIMRENQQAIEKHILRNHPSAPAAPGFLKRIAARVVVGNPTPVMNPTPPRAITPEQSADMNAAAKKIAEAQEADVQQKSADQLKSNPITAKNLQAWQTRYQQYRRDLSAQQAPDLTAAQAVLVELKKQEVELLAKEGLTPENFELYNLLSLQNEMLADKTKVLTDEDLESVGLSPAGLKHLYSAYVYLPKAQLDGIISRFHAHTKNQYQQQLKPILQLRTRLDEISFELKKKGLSKQTIYELNSEYRETCSQFSALFQVFQKNHLHAAQLLFIENALSYSTINVLKKDPQLVTSRIISLLGNNTDPSLQAQGNVVLTAWQRYQAIKDKSSLAAHQAKKHYEDVLMRFWQSHAGQLITVSLDHIKNTGVVQTQQQTINEVRAVRAQQTKIKTRARQQMEIFHEETLPQVQKLQMQYQEIFLQGMRDVVMTRALEDFSHGFSDSDKVFKRIQNSLNEARSAFSVSFDSTKPFTLHVGGREFSFDISQSINHQVSTVADFLRASFESQGVFADIKRLRPDLSRQIDAFFEEFIYTESLCLVNDMHQTHHRESLKKGVQLPGLKQARAIEALMIQAIVGGKLKKSDFGNVKPRLGLEVSTRRFLEAAGISTKDRRLILPLGGTLLRKIEPLSWKESAVVTKDNARFALSTLVRGLLPLSVSEKLGYDNQTFYQSMYRFAEDRMDNGEGLIFAGEGQEEFLRHFSNPMVVGSLHNSWADFALLIYVAQWLDKHPNILAKAGLSELVPVIGKAIGKLSLPVGSRPAEVEQALQELLTKTFFNLDSVESLAALFPELTMPVQSSPTSESGLGGTTDSTVFPFAERLSRLLYIIAAATGQDPTLLGLDPRVFGNFPKPDGVLRYHNGFADAIIQVVHLLSMHSDGTITPEELSQRLTALFQIDQMQAAQKFVPVDLFQASHSGVSTDEYAKARKRARAAAGHENSFFSTALIGGTLGLAASGEVYASPHSLYDGSEQVEVNPANLYIGSSITLNDAAPLSAQKMGLTRYSYSPTTSQDSLSPTHFWNHAAARQAPHLSVSQGQYSAGLPWNQPGSYGSQVGVPDSGSTFSPAQATDAYVAQQPFQVMPPVTPTLVRPVNAGMMR